MIPIFLDCDELDKFAYHNTESKALFEIEDGMLKVLRTKPGTANELTGSTITPEGSTTINGSAEAIDYDKGTTAVLNEAAGNQVVRFTLLSPVICNQLYLKFMLEDAETLMNLTVEVSPDGTNYKEIYNDAPTTDYLYINIDNGIGVTVNDLRLSFHGTSVDPNQILLKEAQLYASVCYPYRNYTPTVMYTYVEVLAKAKLLTMTQFDITSTVSGTADILFQIQKGNSYVWWDGSGWEICSSDPKVFPYESNTETEVNTNMATLLSGTAEFEIGLRCIPIIDGSVSPALEKIEISGT